jgi:hypothetical protein
MSQNDSRKNVIFFKTSAEGRVQENINQKTIEIPEKAINVIERIKTLKRN